MFAHGALPRRQLVASRHLRPRSTSSLKRREAGPSLDLLDEGTLVSAFKARTTGLSFSSFGCPCFNAPRAQRLNQIQKHLEKAWKGGCDGSTCKKAFGEGGGCPIISPPTLIDKALECRLPSYFGLNGRIPILSEYLKGGGPFAFRDRFPGFGFLCPPVRFPGWASGLNIR